jgi:outer membrane protein assembly factor BamD (BamD/ComL family)
VALAFAALLAGCSAGTLPAVHSEPERLALAQRMAAKKDFVDAISLLKTYIDNNGGSAEVDHAVMLLGECYLGTREFASAAVEFERLLREFPESDSCASGSYRLGEAYFGQSKPPDFDQEQTLKAIEQWRAYLTAYPGHWANELAHHSLQTARMRLATKWLNDADLYFKLRQIGPARVYYQRVEVTFSDLPQLGDAWYGLAQCDVSERHYDSAIARLKQIEERFPGRPIAVTAAHARERLTH